MFVTSLLYVENDGSGYSGTWHCSGLSDSGDNDLFPIVFSFRDMSDKWEVYGTITSGTMFSKGHFIYKTLSLKRIIITHFCDGMRFVFCSDFGGVRSFDGRIRDDDVEYDTVFDLVAGWWIYGVSDSGFY